MIQSDVCIVGAGPAGATTSLTLSKMKIPHIILDAAVFPRDKVCGDGLDTTVMRVLNNIEPGCVEKEILTDNHFIQSHTIIIHVNESQKNIINVSSSNASLNYPIFCFSKRSYFDNFLIKKIDPRYARFFQGAKVERIIHENASKIIYAKQDGKEIQIKTKILIGADGDHSAVLRSLGNRKINRKHYAGALRQYWQGISDLKTDVFEMYFPKSLPLGYLWIFPVENDVANVGLGMPSSLIAQENIDLKKMMTELLANDPVIKARFKNATPLENMKGCGLPLATLQRKIYGDGWLLTGDAASIIDPTTGEGIGPAMMSGYIAAHFVERAIQQNNFSEDIFRNYDREVIKRMKRSIQIYRLMQKTSPKIYGNIINYLSKFSFFKKEIIKYFKRKIELAYTEKIPIDFN